MSASPDDLTIPRPGSTTLRGLLSRALARLPGELARLPTRAASPAARAGHAALQAALRAALQAAPGPAWSALRRAPVGALIRCARAGDGELLAPAVATLAVELAVAGALQGELRVAAPPTVVCLGARRALHLPGGTLVCRAGEVVHGDDAGARRVWAADEPVPEDMCGTGPRSATSHVPLAGGLLLALVDGNPLAGVEAHPDKRGNALDLGGQPPARWAAAIDEALAIVEAHLPDLRGELGLVLQEVVPVGYDAERHLSASYQEAIGTVYLSLHPGAMTMAEALIHEGSHAKLAALLECGAALENAHHPRYPSPVRPDPRPLHGVLLAVHAFLPVALLYERMLAADDPRARAPGFRERMARIVAGNREGMAVLRAHARPTPLGAGLLAELDRWDRHFAGAP
jgi:HEXXH motif-containing protein